MTMIGIIDVVPSRWRLEMKPYLSPLELHVQRIDVDSFPMRRLWRLIEKLIRREQEDGYANTPFKSRSLKGSLYIHRKDNGHLQFLPSVPAVIPLEGSTVLADVLDLKQLPRDGCSVYLRWIEDSPRVCLVDADSSVSTNGAWGGTGRAEDVNIAVPLPQSPHRAVRQRYGGYSQHRREDCSDKSCEPQLNDNRNRHRTYSPAPVRKSQTHGDGGRMRPESREEQTEASYVLENIDDEEIPPLTFLHTPPMMYRKPWHGVT
ncbi:hypothetical protein DQ04_16471000 [Trypanosoma grayi]|uniref:hypothetical protein n=1 Tax=Trypanosoma grayi TaxID=71804 RepID=UPI0004F41D02|nr:hypothetical protein DQ04_16471000 [Trypanosoma grayi]KEG06020.1 hypothetical protein DQ04_16471000 [Trypanosoma grayi]